MKPLVRLLGDLDSAQDKADPEDEPESAPPSSHAEKPIRSLQSMYTKLNPAKATKDFADRW